MTWTLGKYRAIIETACHECLVDVTAYADDVGFVDLTLRSTDSYKWQNSVRGKLERIRAILKGRPDPQLTFWTVDEVDRVIAALQEARVVAWPKQPEEAQP